MKCALHMMVGVVVLVATCASAALPARERAIITKVAGEYGLNADQTKMLLAIRVHENGRTGLEFGVGDGRPNHPARRYASNPDASLRLQAQWAAGSVRKRYHGDLRAFVNGGWCVPSSRDAWVKSVSRIMRTI